MAIENDAGVIGANMLSSSDAIKLVFVYDYLGRRVEKMRFARSGSAYATTPTTDSRFLYQGWNLIAEIDGAASGVPLLRSYTWGLSGNGDFDLSGAPGALVQIYDSSGGYYWPTFDDNGNVRSLINASTGAYAAVYEYDPFGNPLRAEAPDAIVKDNPFRFACKYSDVETGLIYYGERFYSTTLGRFVNRDPLEEEGGVNLYGFCGNDGINNSDYLGMTPVWKQVGTNWQVTDTITTWLVGKPIDGSATFTVLLSPVKGTSGGDFISSVMEFSGTAIPYASLASLNVSHGTVTFSVGSFFSETTTQPGASTGGATSSPGGGGGGSTPTSNIPTFVAGSTNPLIPTGGGGANQVQVNLVYFDGNDGAFAPNRVANSQWLQNGIDWFFGEGSRLPRYMMGTPFGDVVHALDSSSQSFSSGEKMKWTPSVGQRIG